MMRILKFLPPLLGAILLVALLWSLHLDWRALFSGDMDAAAQALKGVAQQPGPEKVGVLFLMVTLLPFALVPITAVLLATATLLPPISAFGVIVAGSMATTALSYEVGKRYGVRILKSLRSDRMDWFDAIKSRADRHGFKMALLSRCMPMPFIFAGLSAPMLGLSFGQMLLGSLAAMVPWAFFYVFFTESVRQGSLRFLGPALAVLALIMVALFFARRSLRQDQSATLPEGLLEPQLPALGPVLTLYTITQHEACQEARKTLWDLRPRLKFEVREMDISGSAQLEAQFHDHVPVLFLGTEKLFSFQVDENALEKILRQSRHD